MAWQFRDGQDDHLRFAYSTAMTFPSGGWSLAFWVRALEDEREEDGYIFAQEGESGLWDNSRMLLRKYYYNVYNNIFWVIDGGYATYTTIELDTDKGDPEGTTWHHIAFVWDASEYTLTVYVDGVANETSDAETGWEGQGDKWDYLNFGREDSGTSSSNYLEAELAEFAKWDRELTEEEITALAGGKAPEWYDTDLAWYHPMIDFGNEAVTDQAIDQRSGVVIVDHPSGITYPDGGETPGCLPMILGGFLGGRIIRSFVE